MTRASRPPRAASSLDQLLRMVARGDDDEPDTHVERSHHVLDRHVAASLQPTEERRHLPGRRSTTAAVPCGQHPRQVVGDATAGDVRHPLDPPAVKHRPQQRQVRTVRLEQRVAHRAAQFGDVAVDVKPQLLEHDPPRQ